MPVYNLNDIIAYIAQKGIEGGPEMAAAAVNVLNAIKKITQEKSRDTNSR